jgi:hypothetical protein
VERLVDCLILLTPNGRILDHNNIFSKSFDSKVTDVAIGSDTISLSIPDPVSLLPDPGFACDALRGNGGPPVFVTPHVVDDLFGSIDVYATFEGDTELVLRIPL